MNHDVEPSPASRRSARFFVVASRFRWFFIVAVIVIAVVLGLNVWATCQGDCGKIDAPQNPGRADVRGLRQLALGETVCVTMRADNARNETSVLLEANGSYTA